MAVRRCSGTCGPPERQPRQYDFGVVPNVGVCIYRGSGWQLPGKNLRPEDSRYWTPGAPVWLAPQSLYLLLVGHVASWTKRQVVLRQPYADPKAHPYVHYILECYGVTVV